MMRVVKETGVVAELSGEYFKGQMYGQDAEYGDFGPIETARVSDPKWCKKATDMAHPGYYNYEKLKRAVLRKIIVTKMYEIV